MTDAKQPKQAAKSPAPGVPSIKPSSSLENEHTSGQDGIPKIRVVPELRNSITGSAKPERPARETKQRSAATASGDAANRKRRR